MAAASNKPGAVHYALIVFVMMSVILGITTYMFHREYSDRAAKITELEGKTGTQTTLIKKYDDEIQALKKKTGRNFEQVEDPANAANANTVIGAIVKDLADFGKDLAGTTYAETLQKLREALDAASTDAGSKTAAIATLQKEMNDQKTRLNAQIDTHRKAQEKAEADLRNLVASRDEKLNAKQTEIDRNKADINQLVGELAQEKEGREKQVKKLQEDLTQLETRIDILQDKNNVLSGVRFEQPDGLIVAVNNTSRTVVINLGEKDQLKPRMTFSIYPIDNRALGAELDELKSNVDESYKDGRINITERDDRKQVLSFTGMKGKIEVTRLLGPHSAEARIIEEDLYRPMVPGDVVYTPTWSPGLIERISIIGDIDLDGDGKSDREQFHQFLSVSGVVIDNEVDDAGERLPADGKITVQTKFLVLGNIPDRADIVNDSEKARVDKLISHLAELRKEARVNGVRIVKLNDFLAHVGFQAKRRMFRPGDDKPYSLNSGVLKPIVNEPLGDSASSRDVFRPRSVPQQVSSGATSKLFGGKGK
ncbi:MAG: hypothetical protein AABP62_13635 [Planctomycetota bacterium]